MAIDQKVHKDVLITGASRGIGAAIAERMALEGNRVILLARDLGALEKVKNKIEGLGGTALVWGCDLTQVESIREAGKKLSEFAVTPAVLVNNAGFGGPFHKVNEISLQDWDYVFQVNVRSAFLLTQLFLPKMVENGFGRIINISSVLGLFGMKGSAAYAASKHAMIGFTKTVAAEWGGQGITCNAICPGYIATEMIDQKEHPAQEAAILNQIPVGRLGRPKEIADLVKYLSDQSAAYVNGSVFVIDGGLTSKI